jgi:hypothetical protein
LKTFSTCDSHWQNGEMPCICWHRQQPCCSTLDTLSNLNIAAAIDRSATSPLYVGLQCRIEGLNEMMVGYSMSHQPAHRSIEARKSKEVDIFLYKYTNAIVYTPLTSNYIVMELIEACSHFAILTARCRWSRIPSPAAQKHQPVPPSAQLKVLDWQMPGTTPF